jgi:hypothetical protein
VLAGQALSVERILANGIFWEILGSSIAGREFQGI